MIIGLVSWKLPCGHKFSARILAQKNFIGCEFSVVPGGGG